MHEFELIKKYFSKLSKNNKSSLNLNDDVFFDKKNRLVISIDTYNEGNHFLDFKKPELVIKKIIRSIKRNILPEIQSVTGTDVDGGSGLGANSLSRAFLKYPAVVSINLLGIDESHFLRFKPCMVDNITIDYGASGEIIIAEGGVPQGIKVGMTFKELEIQTAEDYEGDDV